MHTTLKHIVILVFACFLLIACSSDGQEASDETDTNVETLTSPKPNDETRGSDTEADEADSFKNDDEDNSGIQDGAYTATIGYTNPNTGYSATYTLSVMVSGGMVVQINFPNDRYLDEDHIAPATLDEEGNATVEGEEGRTYQVHIDI